MEENRKLLILKDLVAIKTENNNEIMVARYLKQLCDLAGIFNEILPINDDRANFVAEIGDGQPVVVLSGHMDTVIADPKSWQTDPFELTPKGDRLYGRGATDMKSGLAALVIAMIELKEANVQINGTIRLLATAGEEVGQQGAEILTKEGYMKNVAALVIGEPSGYRIAYANKGELDITLTSKGKAAHSSMPKLGNNAVAHLLAILNRLQAQVQQATANLTSPDLGETLFNIDVIHGGEQVNAIPALATAKINIRTIPEFANAKILQIFQDTIAAYNENTAGHIEMTVEMQTSPILGDPKADLVKIAQKVGQPYLQRTNYSAETLNEMSAAAKATGIAFSPTEIVTVGVSGATDAGKFLADRPKGATYLVFGPGNETAHQDNEYVSQQMYLNFIEIYKTMLLTYLNHNDQTR